MGKFLGELFRDRDGRLSGALITKWLFTLLLVGLCVAKALGLEVDLDLLVFVALTAGAGDAAHLLRRGKGGAASAASGFAGMGPAVGGGVGTLRPLRGLTLTQAVVPVRLVPRPTAAQLYSAYNAGGSDPQFINRSYNGQPCPPWANLPSNVKAKWEAVATAAAGAVPDEGADANPDAGDGDGPGPDEDGI